MTNKKWIHFIGIAGVATGQLAVAYKNEGHVVTGSERGLFPPMSTHIEKNDISIEIGYKEEHLNRDYYIKKYGNFKHENNQPDLILVQGAKGGKNPEYLKAKEIGIPMQYYADIIKEEVIVENNSIVISGTYGKTTITSMLTSIFDNAKKEISYMFGGLSLDLDNGVKLKNSRTEYSIVEGDEYVVAYDERFSKFYRYSPKYLILTSAQWDHVDIFPTKEDYITNFKNLVELVPVDGFIVYNGEDENVVELIKSAKCEVFDYSKVEGEKWKNELKVIGEYNFKNSKAAYLISEKLGLKEEQILKGLKNYKGIKRRLEIKYDNYEEIVIDDFGASPSKAQSAIESIKSEYPEYKIIGIFEPNLGSRKRDGLEEYKDTFNSLDEVYLPRFTRVKGEFISNKDLKNYLEDKLENVNAISNDKELLGILKESANNQTIYLFMGSHSFRGMIEGLIHILKTKY